MTDEPTAAGRRRRGGLSVSGVLAVLVLAWFAIAWLFPRSRHVDLALSGPAGSRVVGRYLADGAKHDFFVTLPATVSVEFRRGFEFHAEPQDPAVDFTAKFSSDFMSASPKTDGLAKKVEAEYQTAFPGFSSGRMSSGGKVRDRVAEK